MMSRIWCCLVLIIPCWACPSDMNPLSGAPLVGYTKVAFTDPHYALPRHVCVWYPVSPKEKGMPSPDPWDLCSICKDPPIPGKKPLVLLSHGYEGNPHQLSWLIRACVDQGYVVAGLRHLDRTTDPDPINLWQRARDISLMIDQLLASPLSSQLDANKIVLVGYSLGGTTAIWAAGGRSRKVDSLIPGPESVVDPTQFSRLKTLLPSVDRTKIAQDLREPRIKGIVALSPAWGWIFYPEDLRTISLPAYIVAPEHDQVLVTQANARFFAQHIPHALYQEIPGKAGHYVFLSALSPSQQRKASRWGRLNFLFKNDPSVDRAWIQQQLAERILTFFRPILEESDAD